MSDDPINPYEREYLKVKLIWLLNGSKDDV